MWLSCTIVRVDDVSELDYVGMASKRSKKSTKEHTISGERGCHCGHFNKYLLCVSPSDDMPDTIIARLTQVKVTCAGPSLA
jgi:hypothetical protein